MKGGVLEFDGCLWCGTDIDPRDSNAPFCSYGCRVAWWQDGD